MRKSGDVLERDGDAFSRAFESAREWSASPEARLRLRQAVADLITSGALLPHEAEDFEDTLITSRGCFRLPAPAKCPETP